MDLRPGGLLIYSTCTFNRLENEGSLEGLLAEAGEEIVESTAFDCPPAWGVRSPRGRFTAENSWKLLESRLLKRRSMKRFWMRTASAAAVVLLCVTSWAAYQFLYVAPPREAIPTEAIHTTEETQVIHSVLTFDQQPLQEIVRQLSETFRTDIRIEGDSLKNYHMTATFREGESLTEILDLLKDAGNFTYKKENNTIILTTKLN